MKLHPTDEKKYKIAFVLTSVTYGGLEKVSSCFLNNYNKQKFEIHTVVFHRPWQNENNFIHWLETSGEKYTKIASATTPAHKKRDFLKVPRRYLELYSFLKKGGFDLIHTNGTLADLTGIPVAKMLGVPCISTCHGFIANDRKLKLYNRINILILKLCSGVIAVSHGIRDCLLENGIKKDTVFVIENAVPTEHKEVVVRKNRVEIRKKLGFNGEDFVLGFIGRLSQEKGCKYLIEATLQLKKLGVPIKTLIIGEGAEHDELQVLVQKKNLGKEVVFAGFQADVENWFPALECFILPSLTEGTPMALLEAMSFGLPVVASSVGGVPDVIVPEGNGFLVEPGSSEDIAQVVYRIYKNKPEAKKISSEAIKTIATKYNVKGWVARVEKQYLEILEHPSSAG